MRVPAVSGERVRLAAGLVVLAAGVVPAAGAAETGGSRPADAVSASLETTVRFAEVGGRSLSLTENRLEIVAPRERLRLWWGEQRGQAEGRYSVARQTRNRFETDASRVGVAYALRGGGGDDTARQTLLMFESLRSREGEAVQGKSSATFPGPHGVTVGLSYREPARRGGTRTLRAELGIVRGGTLRAEVAGVGAGIEVPLNRQLRMNLQAAVQAQHSTATGAAFKPFAQATLALTPAAGTRLEMGVSFAPRGFALSGTPLGGLGQFGIYQPGGAAQQFLDRPSGFGTLSLRVARTF